MRRRARAPPLAARGRRSGAATRSTWLRSEVRRQGQLLALHGPAQGGASPGAELFRREAEELAPADPNHPQATCGRHPRPRRSQPCHRTEACTDLQQPPAAANGALHAAAQLQPASWPAQPRGLPLLQAARQPLQRCLLHLRNGHHPSCGGAARTVVAAPLRSARRREAEQLSGGRPHAPRRSDEYPKLKTYTPRARRQHRQRPPGQPRLPRQRQPLPAPAPCRGRLRRAGPGAGPALRRPA